MNPHQGALPGGRAGDVGTYGLHSPVELQDPEQREGGAPEPAGPFLSVVAILDACPTGAVWIGADRRVVCANLAFCGMVGLAREDLVGMTEAEFDDSMRARCSPGHPYTSCSTLAQFDRREPAIPGVPTIALSPILCDKSDGMQCGCDVILDQPARVHLRRTVRFVDDPRAGMTRILYFEDVTRERTVEVLKREFMVTVSHEMRTPLTMINGYAEAMLLREHDAESQTTMLRAVLHHGQHLARVLENVLDLARLERRAFRKQPLHPIDLRQWLLSACSEFHRVGDARRPELVLQPGQFGIKADVELLTRGLHELLTNAYRFSYGRGRISVTLQETRVEGARWTCIAVEDEGIGMSEADQSRAFIPFWRGDKSGRELGCGLGLSLVKEVAGFHRGKVELASRLAEGTCVTLWLPNAALESEMGPQDVPLTF